MRPHFIASSRQEMLSICDNELSLAPDGLLFILNNDHFMRYFMEKRLSDAQNRFIILNLTDIYTFWTDFTSFLDVFFTLNETGRFKVHPQVFRDMERKALDPFVVISRKLKRMADDGVKPVILIQDIAQPVFEESRNMELLREVLDLFVAMSKEAHHCHVFIDISDKVVLGKVFLETRLSKSAEICALRKNNQ